MSKAKEQRTIKFRAKSIETNKWVFGYYYVRQTGHCFILDYEGNKHLINRSTLGQFTGLKDKRKVEIYEGDIIKIYNPRQNSYQIKLVVWDNDNAGFDGLWAVNLMYYEIIGNKFDNPDFFN